MLKPTWSRLWSVEGPSTSLSGDECRVSQPLRETRKMRRIRTTSDWTDAISASTDIPTWVKRVLLEYGVHMDNRRSVSYPRVKIATSLGIAERNVTKALTHAKSSGWIVVVTPGQRGRTAAYQGTFGGQKTMRDMRDPISQHVDTSPEGPANDCKGKVGSRHIKTTSQGDNIIIFANYREGTSLSRTKEKRSTP